MQALPAKGRERSGKFVESQQIRPPLGPVGKSAGVGEVALLFVETPENVGQWTAPHLAAIAADAIDEGSHPSAEGPQPIAALNRLVLVGKPAHGFVEWNVTVETSNGKQIILGEGLAEDSAWSYACEIEQTARREMVTKLEDFLRRRSKISLVVRHEDVINAPGLKEACKILFADQADEKLQEYIDSMKQAMHQ